MPVNADDVFRLIGFIQDDLRQTQVKLVELRTWLASMELPTDRPAAPCDVCGVVRPSQRALVEHLENVHGIIAAQVPDEPV